MNDRRGRWPDGTMIIVPRIEPRQGIGWKANVRTCDGEFSLETPGWAAYSCAEAQIQRPVDHIESARARRRTGCTAVQPEMLRAPRLRGGTTPIIP